MGKIIKSVFLMRDFIPSLLVGTNLIYNWISFFKDLYMYRFLDSGRHFISAAIPMAIGEIMGDSDNSSFVRVLSCMALTASTASSAISVNNDLGRSPPTHKLLDNLPVKISAYDASIVFAGVLTGFAASISKLEDKGKNEK